MSAPDKIYLNILDDGRWMNLPQKAPCPQVALMDGETVETYHHDRVVLDLRRRLDALVEFLEDERHNTDDTHVAGYYRTELSSAIEAAKGGK